MGLLRRWKEWRQARGREIFAFWDGQRTQHADPMTIYRALLRHPRFDWSTSPALVELLNEGDRQTQLYGCEGAEVCLEAVRDAFRVKPFEPGQGGLTEGEMLSLLADFTTYVESQKKSTNPSPTSAGSTGSLPTSPSSSTSDCTSTSPGSRPDGPAPSAKESETASPELQAANFSTP